MLRSLTSLLLLLLFMSAGAAPVRAADDASMMTRQQADTLLASGRLRHLRSKSEIPKVWWEAMGLDGMSDIGGPFSSGCTGPEPHRRLITGAISEPYAVLVTEQGGIAYFTELRLFKHKKDAVKCVYHESVREPRLNEIREKLGESHRTP